MKTVQTDGDDHLGEPQKEPTHHGRLLRSADVKQGTPLASVLAFGKPFPSKQFEGEFKSLVFLQLQQTPRHESITSHMIWIFVGVGLFLILSGIFEILRRSSRDQEKVQKQLALEEKREQKRKFALERGRQVKQLRSSGNKELLDYSVDVATFREALAELGIDLTGVEEQHVLQFQEDLNEKRCELIRVIDPEDSCEKFVCFETRLRIRLLRSSHKTDERWELIEVVRETTPLDHMKRPPHKRRVKREQIGRPLINKIVSNNADAIASTQQVLHDMLELTLGWQEKYLTLEGPEDHDAELLVECCGNQDLPPIMIWHRLVGVTYVVDVAKLRNEDRIDSRVLGLPSGHAFQTITATSVFHKCHSWEWRKFNPHRAVQTHSSSLGR